LSDIVVENIEELRTRFGGGALFAYPADRIVVAEVKSTAWPKRTLR
jgi:hypothetical protein